MIAEEYFSTLKALLKPYHVKVNAHGDELVFSAGDKKISVTLFKEEGHGGLPGKTIPLDVFVNNPEKMVGVIRSRLGLNETIFARKTEVRKLSKPMAENFHDTYHVMGAASSAYNYGLFSDGELVAVASFSKGRKMDRLPDEQRSFELIRFCTKSGITVSGGLSKLIKHFIREKNPGDIMTYVDKQFAGGEAFFKMGFKKTGETGPVYFLVDKKTLIRQATDDVHHYDRKKYYLVKNDGNLKLVLRTGDES